MNLVMAKLVLPCSLVTRSSEGLIYFITHAKISLLFTFCFHFFTLSIQISQFQLRAYSLSVMNCLEGSLSSFEADALPVV
jgi:hypothetical protein